MFNRMEKDALLFEIEMLQQDIDRIQAEMETAGEYEYKGLQADRQRLIDRIKKLRRATK